MLGLIGGIVGGLMQGSAAKKAARAQERAADKQIEFSRETRDLTREDLRPFYQPGVQAQNALSQIYGLGGTTGGQQQVERYTVSEGKPAGNALANGMVNPFFDERDKYNADALNRNPVAATDPVYGWRVGDREFGSEADARAYADSASQPYEMPMQSPWEWEMGEFEADPGYQFRLQQGLEAMQGSVARRHGLSSGATQAALNDYAGGMASDEYARFYGREMDEYSRAANQYYNYLNGLTGIAQGGQNAAAGMGAANTQAAQQINTAYANQGNAQAAGYIGQGNALSQGINNAVSSWQFNKLLSPAGGSAGGGGTNFLNGLW